MLASEPLFVCTEAYPEPAVSVKGKCQWRRHEPPVYSVQSVMDWPDPLGSFAMSF